MSVIYKTGRQICQGPLNHSTSKQMYSFGKAARFKEIKSFQAKNDFYDLPSTQMRRYTKFAYPETKPRVTKKQEDENKEDIGGSGAAGKLIVTEFKRSSSGPCYTFSSGRDKYGKVYIDTVKMLDKDIPGPGKYNYLKRFGSDAPAYTIKGRNESTNNKKKKNKRERGEMMRMRIKMEKNMIQMVVKFTM